MLVLLVATLLVAQDKPDDPAKTVKELQKERIATLEKVVAISTKLAQTGRVEIGEALEARMGLLKAEVELAEKESDRITIYQNALAELTALLKLAQTQFEAGRATELAIHKVKARFLEVKILLEKARIREAKEGK